MRTARTKRTMRTEKRMESLPENGIPVLGGGTDEDDESWLAELDEDERAYFETFGNYLVME